MVSKKTVGNPLDSKGIKLVNPKENQPLILIGRIDDGAEAPHPWSPDVKSWLIGKDPDAAEDWGTRRWVGRQKMKWLDNITDSVDMSLSKLWEIVKEREA